MNPETGVTAAARQRPSHSPGEMTERARLEVVFAIMLGLFLSALDQTIVGTALPRIISDLHGSEWYTWVVTVYLITSTVTVPMWGKLSDLFGRKPMLMIGIALFLLGSALCGLSQEMWQLILFRGIQGLGAGAIFPVSLAVIGDLFTPAERGKYQGLFGGVFGISALVGPFLGGVLTDTVGWHWVFYVNMPIGAIALFIIWRILPTFRREGARPTLDYLGILVFAAGISVFLIGITNKDNGDWTDFWVGGLMAIGLAIFAVFLVIERFAEEPIVPLDLFRNPIYFLSVVATFFVNIGFLAMIIFLPLWYQLVKGTSATLSGYQVLPLLVGMIGASIASGYIISRTGRYKPLLLFGTATMAFGLFLMTHLETDTPYPVLWLWMFITGLGIGPTLPSFTIVVQNVLPLDRLGVGTGNLTFFRQVGSAVGSAVAGWLFGDTLRTQILPQLTAHGVPSQLTSQMGNAKFNMGDLSVGANVGQMVMDQAEKAHPGAGHVIAPFVANINAAFNDAVSAAVAQTFWAGVVTSLIALGVIVFLRQVPLRRTLQAPEAPAPVTAALPVTEP